MKLVLYCETMKHRQISYGYQNCMFDGSLTKHLNPPICVHYRVLSIE